MRNITDAVLASIFTSDAALITYTNKSMRDCILCLSSRCQFIIAIHSLFMLGTLNAKIYNLDTKDYDIIEWNDLRMCVIFMIFSRDMKVNLGSFLYIKKKGYVLWKEVL